MRKNILKEKGLGKIKKDNYKNKWKAFSINKSFWREALLGRSIKRIYWAKDGIKALALDDGIKLVFPKWAKNQPRNTFCIRFIDKGTHE